MKLKTRALKMLALVMGVTCSFLSSAAGIGIINGSTGEYMKLVKSDVQVTVNNQIATIKVTEVFENTSSNDVQFKYGFPLSENANPILLRWSYQGNWYQAYMSSAAQNNDIPGTGGGGGGGGSSIDPDLENYLGDSPLLFTTVDTIPPGAQYTIELTYVELLTYEMGVVLFDLTHDLSGLQTTPVDTQTFSFQLFSDRQIVSADLIGLSTNDVMNPYDATLSMMLLNQPANFDYHLNYELFSNSMGVIPFSVMMPDSVYTCDNFGDGYATFIVEPRPSVDTDVMPKNFTLIIDKSGSMYGTKMEEAKDAAIYILEHLNAGDYFNVISFESSVQSAFASHVPFNPTNKATALDFVNALNANGGTNIDDALSEAISQYVGVSPGMANIVLFLTDGQGMSPNQVTLDLVEAEADAAGVDIYINTIAIGQGANEALMVLLAEENGGLTMFIEDEAVEAEIIAFFNLINNPVLLNTTISFSPHILEEIYPATIPNLYQGQQMILSARYDSAQTVTMTMTGEAFGVPVSYTFNISLSDSADEDYYILPKIWAKQKIDYLGVQYFYTSSSAFEDEIDSLSLCYQVLDVQFGSFDGGFPVGLEEELAWHDGQLQVNAYPQPFDSYIQLQFPSAETFDEPLLIEILDLTGKVIYSEVIQPTSGIVTIDNLDKLLAGTYILNVSTGENRYTTKLVKF